MNYGLPYQGSKNRIAVKVVQQLPDCPDGTLYDLFCGGCAVTHAAMLDRFMGRHKFGRFVVNDVNAVMPAAFKKATEGGFRDEQRWISREDFQRLKDTDPYVALCFSFGNDGRTYCYGRELEPYKRACHYAVVFDEWADFNHLCPEVCEAVRLALDGVKDRKERRIRLGRAIVKEIKRQGDPALLKRNRLYSSIRVSRHDLPSHPSLQSLQSLESLERLQSLESLQSLERLESLQSLERLEAYSGDYQDVPLTGPGVIYCDPPYKGTSGYGMEFDYDRFYDWCERQTLPVFISEYAMPSDRFVEVFSTSHLNRRAATTSSRSIERLFRPRVQVERKAVA